jgi:hypothetical protein
VYVEVLKEIIQNNVNFVIKQGLLDDDKLAKYDKSNVHSILQYCLLRVEGLGLLALPEFKIKLRKPIDKHEVLGEPRGRARYQWTVRVDVEYLKGLEVVGIGEVITPDEIHGVPSPKMPRPTWITPSHKIEHLVRDRRPEFLIVLNVTNKYPPWKNVKTCTLEEWEELWKDFIRSVCEQEKIECLHVIMKSVLDTTHTAFHNISQNSKSLNLTTKRI